MKGTTQTSSRSASRQVRRLETHGGAGTPLHAVSASRQGRRFEISPYRGPSIGNRTNAMIGGDINGNNQRTISYTPNNLNEYSTVVTPGYKDVMGAAWTTNVLTVNAGATDRKGEYFHKELSIANGSGPVWQSIQVTNNGVQVTNGYVLFPKNSQSQTNDYDGNLTGDGLWNYTWDAENRLTKVESVSSLPNAAKRRLEFGYDHQGRRIWSKISTNNGSYVVSRNTRFVYDGWNLVAELNATNNAPQRTYLWGNDLSGTMDGAGGIGGLVAIRDHGVGTYHFTCYDGNGNVMALVNAADQSISAQYEYSPFGELIRATEPMAKKNPFRWSTKYWDEETGLVYYGYRYYSPTLGRWVGRDPVESDQNLYIAFNNYPVNAIDPDGKETYVTITLGSVGGILDHADLYIKTGRNKKYDLFTKASAAFGKLNVSHDVAMLPPDSNYLVLKVHTTKEEEQRMLDYIESGKTAMIYAYCAPRVGEIMSAGQLSGYSTQFGPIGSMPVLTNPSASVLRARIFLNNLQEQASTVGRAFAKVGEAMFEAAMAEILGE